MTMSSQNEKRIKRRIKKTSMMEEKEREKERKRERKREREREKEMWEVLVKVQHRLKMSSNTVKVWLWIMPWIKCVLLLNLLLVIGKIVNKGENFSRAIKIYFVFEREKRERVDKEILNTDRSLPFDNEHFLSFPQFGIFQLILKSFLLR